ncbi:MAG: hypothetical protein V3U11_11420, partial [Planctomycetota bacterium]
MKKTLVVLLVAGVAALVLFIGLELFDDGGTGDGATAVGTAKDAGPGASESRPLEGKARSAGEQDPDRREVVSTKADPAAAKAKSIVIRGTCVAAETGEPLAGCDVTVHSPTKTDGETDTNGRFELSFEVEKPAWVRVTLGLGAGHFVPLERTWSKVSGGTILDVGKVTLRVARKLNGVVVDTGGAPQANTQVDLSAETFARSWPDDGFRPVRGRLARTDARGWFAVTGLAAGSWEVGVWYKVVVRPDTLTVVEGDDPLPDVEVVVKRQVGGISGSVVDTSGRPVAGAILSPVPYWAGGRIHFTDDEGRFAIPRHEGDPDGPVQLQVDKLGYEVLLSGKHPADSKDVRLVLSPGIGFDLHVTRSDTGRPVEEYGIRLLSQPWQTMPDGSEHWITRGCPLLHRGRHDGGRLRVPAQRTGNYYLRVVPKDKTLHQPGLLRFTVAPDMTPLQVQVGLETQRLLRVVTRGGAPVEKTRVELLHRIFVKPVDLESSALEDMMSLGKSSAWLQQRGRTDAKGEVVLTGPASSRYALRALGPGHRPEVLNDVELAPDLGVLVVKVWAGATLTGQAGPVATLKALTPDSKGALRLVNLNPGLYLVSHENRDVRWPVDSWESFPFGADGSFKITGIPPGTWE